MRTKRDVSKCCIRTMKIGGHCSAGLGGNTQKPGLSKDQIAELGGLLCKGATITQVRCYSDDISGTIYEQLLQVNGGIHIGYWGLIPGMYIWNLPPGSPIPADVRNHRSYRDAVEGKKTLAEAFPEVDVEVKVPPEEKCPVLLGPDGQPISRE